jgi:hypothetical protein
MDTNLVVTLLTATVVILSVVIVAMLTVMIIVLVKVQRIAKSINEITQHVASATEWLSPVTLISHVAKLFRK